MTSYLIVSLLLHALFIVSISFNMKEEPKTSLTPVQVEMITSSEIIELEQGLGETKQELKNFYWGIGVEIRPANAMGFFGHEITSVKKGYTAELGGLQVGDIMYLVDDQPIDFVNDVRGDEPKKLKLTIYRNGAIIIKYIERCKVYY